MNERETLPPATGTENEIPMPQLDVGAIIIGNLIDAKLGAFLEAQAARDERQTQMLANALDHALASHDAMTKAKEMSERADVRSREALEMAEDNKRRIERLEERMNG